ncbi:hypothetical protein CKF94_03475 [Vibrio coralliilyticus]|uniref:hypothetical protein n=1 Tax=Vibrio coralliilyticus TaxID=190893 RepID=UPI000BAAF439|nr:hypothetical protein [Vibrio coralliilyticus]MCC2520600.1 hypothetical protein [Vibrio coralliilyticus]PAU40135.1 hypothetical protein CKF94_03475 [Vibrio coralliilyticus]
MNSFKLITPHGDYLLEFTTDSMMVKDVLSNNGIPYNSVSAYVIDGSGMPKCIPFQTSTVKELLEQHHGFDVVFRADRNIDYQAVIGKDWDLYRDPNAEPTAEYTFDNHDGSSKKHVLMSQEECHEFVNEEVRKFTENFVEDHTNKKIVVGISGGGDSNTLLTSLIYSGVPKENIIPVMMMGIADWDKGLHRAHQVCENVGLKLKVIGSDEVDVIIRGKSDGGSWAEDFEKCYPESDLEVIGTLGIRLVLGHVARENDTNIIVTGLNLEDILAESMYSVIRGENLSPFPIRQIDDIDIWYPLYRCPKRILDGCHPKLSLENYMDRFPSNLYWRACSYYIAQSMSTVSAGIEFLLVDGLQKQSQRNPLELTYYKELGFSALPDISTESLTKWDAYINQEDEKLRRLN